MRERREEEKIPEKPGRCLEQCVYGTFGGRERGGGVVSPGRGTVSRKSRGLRNQPKSAASYKKKRTGDLLLV